MNREDIIRMAREAIVGYPDCDPENIPPLEGDELAVFERFAALVAAHVRETEFKPDWNNYRQGLADGAAAEREALEKIDWTALLRQGALVTWGDAETLADRVIATIRARGQA